VKHAEQQFKLTKGIKRSLATQKSDGRNNHWGIKCCNNLSSSDGSCPGYLGPQVSINFNYRGSTLDLHGDSWEIPQK
jgi:hypothetical protein